MLGLMGKKIGMTSIYAEDGRQIPVTVIDTRGNVVVAFKTEEVDGYNAVVLGFGERRTKCVPRPELGHIQAYAALPEGQKKPVKGAQAAAEGQTVPETVKRHLREFRVSAEVLAGLNVGDEIKAPSMFYAGQKADVRGTSRGRGYAGVMKRHNFAGFKASHGVSEYYRHGGSISANTYPARVFKNKKMAGQYGNVRVTVQSQRVADVMADEGLVLIKGGVPGANGSIVELSPAIKVRQG